MPVLAPPMPTSSAFVTNRDVVKGKKGRWWSVFFEDLQTQPAPTQVPVGRFLAAEPDITTDSNISSGKAELGNEYT